MIKLLEGTFSKPGTTVDKSIILLLNPLLFLSAKTWSADCKHVLRLLLLLSLTYPNTSCIFSTLELSRTNGEDKLISWRCAVESDFPKESILVNAEEGAHDLFSEQGTPFSVWLVWQHHFAKLQELHCWSCNWSRFQGRKENEKWFYHLRAY